MLVAVGEPPPRPSVAVERFSFSPTHFMYPVVNYVKDTDVTFTKKLPLKYREASVACKVINVGAICFFMCCFGEVSTCSNEISAD